MYVLFAETCETSHASARKCIVASATSQPVEWPQADQSSQEHMRCAGVLRSEQLGALAGAMERLLLR